VRRTPVRSSHVASVGYDPASRVLEIGFHSGSVYQYFGVPPDVYRAILSAPSVGRYVRQHVAYAYPYVRVWPPWPAVRAGRPTPASAPPRPGPPPARPAPPRRTAVPPAPPPTVSAPGPSARLGADAPPPPTRPRWPSLSDFYGAMQRPDVALLDPVVRTGSVQTDALGLPRVSTGRFACVFRVDAPGDGGPRAWAVRCFTHPMTDEEARYRAIAAFLATHPVACLVPPVFQAQGIRVAGAVYPVVLMPWVEGRHLDRLVADAVGHPEACRRLLQAWRRAIAELHASGAAHGDLQAANVLGTEDALYLVDYDDLYVPGMAQGRSLSLGHRDYQRPDRRPEDFGPGMDAFSIRVIDLSLAAVAADPSLWSTFHDTENLIFRHEDFLHPGATPLWRRLAASPDPEVRTAAEALRSELRRPPTAGGAP
jgi:hypothetical protein